MYHALGASGYRLIIFMCTSGFSCVLALHCRIICSRLFSHVYTTSDAMAAKERPYDMAKVVLMKRGE